MLHSRLTTPKLIPKTENNQQSRFTLNNQGRSKSTASFVQVMTSKLQSYRNSQKNTEIVLKKSLTRTNTAFPKKKQQLQLTSLPKVSSMKGKLHLGKVIKPALILTPQIRNNPWAQPSPIDQNLINKKGLMDIINMGVVPKNIDFTQLLNHRYEQKKIPILMQQRYQSQQNQNNFFTTNPALQIKQKYNQPPNTSRQQQKQKQKQDIRFSSQLNSQKKIRKKVKRGHSNKKNKNQFDFIFKQQPVILQICNKNIVKDQKYHEQFKKLMKDGRQIVFLQYIKKVQKFAMRYGLKKFQFKLLLDETRKISDSVIKHQIINAKALGVYMAMKGNIRKRVYEVALMFGVRFKFKKSLRDILKIEKIKRYFKIKKYYQQMTKKRNDFLKFKLGSFAQRQRRFIEESKQKNQNFRVQMHLLSISGKNYDEQMSYYKLQCRNNIQLTRIFNQKPEYLVLLMQQEVCDLSSWVKLLQRLKGYHPTIIPIFSSLKNSKIRGQDSIYYGLNSQVIQRIRKISNKKQDICLFPSSFGSSIVKICQAFNAKLYSSSFWKPHLQKLLIDDQQETTKDNQSFQKIKKNIMESIDQKQKTALKNINNYNQTVSLQIIKSSTNINTARQKNIKIRTQAQIKHIIQKAKTKELNSFQLVCEYFSTKLKIKQQIFMQFGYQTPKSIIIRPETQQKQLFIKFTQAILINKNVNKWVFKMATSARFSRGLAYLETDSLKILKQKKKKSQLSQKDITQVANIMKIILIDKLQIPQNFLCQSNQYLDNFLKYGGYVEAVIPQTSSQCIFGRISPKGVLQILGTYSKIYTQQGINCAGTYPSENITSKMLSQIKKLSTQIYNRHRIFGNITYQFLVDKKTKKHYFIDAILCLQQYSSLYFMYESIFNHMKQCSQSLTIIKKISQMKMRADTTSTGDKKSRNKQKSQKVQKKQKSITRQIKTQQEQKQRQKQNILYAQQQMTTLPRKIIYIPFIDNNGNTHETFQQFQQSFTTKSLKILDMDDAQGIQFLYLNLKQQKPDVLSLVAFAKDERKVMKYVLDGLNFLTDSGEKINKFDRKIQRRKYDCLYLYDIIWKLREIKKYRDLSKIQQ